jgi:hypothetical protein
MTTIVRITDPINWYQRFDWLQQNSTVFGDYTNWSAWQVGLDDIYVQVDDVSATMYYLGWKP